MGRGRGERGTARCNVDEGRQGKRKEKDVSESGVMRIHSGCWLERCDGILRNAGDAGLCALLGFSQPPLFFS